MAIVGQPSCKWRAIVKRVFGAPLRKFETSLKRVYFSPECQYFLFLAREVERLGNCGNEQMSDLDKDWRTIMLRKRHGSQDQQIREHTDDTDLKNIN